MCGKYFVHETLTIASRQGAHRKACKRCSVSVPLLVPKRVAGKKKWEEKKLSD